MLSKILIATAICLFALAVAEEVYQNTPSSPKNLYRVAVGSHADAIKLIECGIDPLLRIDGGYLVLAEGVAERNLAKSGLKFGLVTTDVSRDNIALDIRLDDYNLSRFPIVYEDTGVRLFRVNLGELYKTETTPGLAPIRTEHIRITYDEGADFEKMKAALDIDLESIINLVDTDSLISYLETLQAFDGRMAGTPGNYAARDWLAGKLTDFGYDSVVIDDFVARPGVCNNVFAVKVGTVSPEYQIIVGAHYDAVAGSPGADDNGTGTAGVLEAARILSGIDTKLTFVFILFDSEEQGLNGAWHYANRAALRGDKIVCMLNMDMIGYYENDADASLYHGDDSSFAQLWAYLADSLTGINLTGHLGGSWGASDHYPFQQNGFSVVFTIESIFSTVYHSNQDSTTYISYDYFTRMLQATLATAIASDNSFVPAPWLTYSYPDGLPQMLAPDNPTTFGVEVQPLFDAVIIPNSGTLHYSVDGGPYNTALMNDYGGGVYDATIPAQACGSYVRYYISFDEVTSGTIADPDPANPPVAGVGTTMNIIFEDDFETDKGWTVQGSAADGHWERGIPVGGGNRGDPPADYDGSGYCYLTGSADGNSDVDDGATILDSPVFDLSDADAVIKYARWYSNAFGHAPFEDVFQVFISSDGGSSWVLAEQAGPTEQASYGWYEHSFWAGEFVTRTDNMKLRFVVSDLGDGSVVEAGIDAVEIRSFICTGSTPYIVTDYLPDGATGSMYPQQLLGSGGTGNLTWSDKYYNLTGTGLSLSADGLLSGTPVSSGTITFTAVLTDEAMVSDEKEFSFEIDAALIITTESLPNGYVLALYYYQIESSGGAGTIAFSDKYNVLGGSGLTLSPDGLLSGTPIVSGDIELTVLAEDDIGGTDEKLLNLHIDVMYLCGDVDIDGKINLLDATFLIRWLYKGGPEPEDFERANVNGSGQINILDITFLITYLYKGGPEPPCGW